MPHNSPGFGSHIVNPSMASMIVFLLHIDAGAANETLMLMSKQTNVEVAWDYTLLESYDTHPIQGAYGLFEGWCALLAGSGLTFRYGRGWVFVLPEAHPGELDATCQDKPNGFGPDFIHPPVADWK